MAKTVQSSFLTTARVGTRNLPNSYTWAGGEVAGEAVSDRAPGQAYPSAVGSAKTISAVTLGWTFDPVVFTDAVIADLFNQIGRDDAVTATRRPKDANGAPFGKGRTYVGTLTAVREPETDSMATTDRAVLEIEFQPSSVA